LANSFGIASAKFTMKFPESAYAGSAAAGFVVTLTLLPVWRIGCLRMRLVDEPGGRKIHESPIPLAGGPAVLSGMLVAFAAAVAAVHFQWFAGLAGERLSYGFEHRAGQLAAIFGGAVGMTLLGWLDDRHELRPALKFTGQVLVAGLVAASGVRITLFVPNLFFSFAITVLWIVTVTNALNFLDNMNGLCAGLGVIAATLFGLKAALLDQYLVASIAFLAAGALLGFLFFNFPRASVFLGDSGSHLTGFLLAVLAILPHFHSPERPRPLAVLTPLLVLAVPLADLVWVVLLRWRRGQPFYIGDTNHISHRLVRRSLSRSQAVLVVWGIAAAVGSLAFFL
jgi:UDP-GlcNAc:undecaprenyl-phosphate GlcNAc-1-phosphate transferase